MDVPGERIRMQRFFSSTTMPATDWRAPLYSDERAALFGHVVRRGCRAGANLVRGRVAGRLRSEKPLPVRRGCTVAASVGPRSAPRGSSLRCDCNAGLTRPACRSMSATGRDDPCPCGSGRKFKRCCLRALDADDAARMRLRTEEGVLVLALFAYAAVEFGDAAWEEFFLWDAVPDDIDSSREFGTTFDPFFVFSFVPDAAETDLPPDWPTEPVAFTFCSRRSRPVPTSTASFHRAGVQESPELSSSNRPRLADRSISKTS